MEETLVLSPEYSQSPVYFLNTERSECMVAEKLKSRAEPGDQDVWHEAHIFLKTISWVLRDFRTGLHVPARKLAEALDIPAEKLQAASEESKLLQGDPLQEFFNRIDQLNPLLEKCTTTVLEHCNEMVKDGIHLQFGFRFIRHCLETLADLLSQTEAHLGSIKDHSVKGLEDLMSSADPMDPRELEFRLYFSCTIAKKNIKVNEILCQQLTKSLKLAAEKITYLESDSVVQRAGHSLNVLYASGFTLKSLLEIRLSLQSTTDWPCENNNPALNEIGKNLKEAVEELEKTPLGHGLAVLLRSCQEIFLHNK